MADNRRSLMGWVWPPPPIATKLWVAVAGSALYSAAVWWVGPDHGLLQPLLSTFAALNTAVLGLLVSFRTKVAYDRWWEGRVLWGSLVNHSRNLCLKARELVPLDPAERAAFAALVTAFPLALLHHLRGRAVLTELPGFEKDNAAPAHVPAHLAGKVFAALAAWRRAERIDGFVQRMLDQHAVALMDVCGACERIRNTPLSDSYLSLLRHGLLLGFLLTPWALVQTIGFWAVGVQALAVYLLFGLELTAEAVEQPFGTDRDDLPLERYCETIRASAEQILA